jgi:hypothetical protein
MTSAMSFLAVPIKARVASDGRLLSADPPIWRLHSWAGGDDGGVLAIPSLAALAALAIKTGMRVERAVRAADEDTDVELWVEATADKQHADLLITGWRDVSNSAPAERTESLDTAAAPSHEIWIDVEHRIVRLPSFLPHHAIGQHFGALFIIQSDAKGRIPVLEALTERSAIHDAPVSVHGDSTAYRLNLTPQFAADGAFIGHGGTAHPQADAMQGEAAPATAGSVEKPVPASELPMSRQLASVLKQPLDRIVANAETIGSKVYGPLRDNYAEYAQDIANAARHLAELVSDMEDLDAIDRPDFSVARDRIELGDVARRVAGLLALKASDHSIRLVVPGDDQHVPAIGEFRRVLQIMLNLVGNAIRYAPGGSIVTIAIEKQGEAAAVSVSDEGQGVAEEDRQRVFEKFERLGRSGDGGSGLGLYISRKLARAMGGDLQVLDAPSGGARFQLTLPAR